MVKLTTDLLKHSMPEKGKRLELRDDDEPGLIFRVTDTGERSWSVRYRSAAGEQRRKRLGPYPSVSLSSARDAARRLKGAVASGIDIVEQERLAKAAAVGARLNTIKALGEQYFADAARGLHRPNATPKRISTLTEERRIFDKLIVPEMGKTPITEPRRASVQTFVSKVSKKSASNGRQVRNVLRQIYSYAVWKDLVENNPAQGIAVVSSKPRERVLTDDELKVLWQAWSKPQDFQGLQLSPEMGLALRLAAVALVRGQEIVGARKAELDLKARTWLIPASRMKGKRPHLVPLSPLAIEIVEQALALSGESVFVFPSPRGAGEDVPMDRSAFTRAMSRVCAILEIEKATPHDFRRTGATNITSERIGMSRFIVSQILAHATDTGGAAAVTGMHYDLNDYLPEKRKALDAWAALLALIISGATGTNSEEAADHRYNGASDG